MPSEEEGSPPHTRGIPGELAPQLHDVGFTPAYAGNTKTSKHVTIITRVHPRIRGEYLHVPQYTRQTRGSPPHTRGIPVRGIFKARNSGFTPAYAGNTGNTNNKRFTYWVHPRIRGEYK